MPTDRTEEPEVVDLGLVEPVDSRDRPTSQRDDGRPEDAPPHPPGSRWQQARTAVAGVGRSARSAAAVAGIVGAVVGAFAYATVDRQQEAATARNEPTLLAQVVSTDEFGGFAASTLLVSVHNVGEHPVTVDAVTVDTGWAASDEDSRPERVEPGQQETFRLRWELRCDEPVPPMDAVEVDLITVDEVRRSVQLPLASSPQQRVNLEGIRSYECSPDERQPAVYARTSVRLAGAAEDEVRIRLTLQAEGGGRPTTLTGLTPNTAAFTITVDGLPLTFARGPGSASVDTVWRVADCALAANATPFDAALVPVVDGEPLDSRVDVDTEPFADLVRLGARVCAGG